MKPINPKTELIEVIEEGLRSYRGRVRFKGKLIHPEVVNICGAEIVEIAMPAEYLFDFTAKELPEIMNFGVLSTQGECLGLLQVVNLIKREKHAEMSFYFTIDDETPPEGELNPYITLPLFIALAKKENYNIKTYKPEPYNYAINFEVPLSDHVYPHYAKYLAAFEKLCVVIETDLVKSLNNRLKKKRAKTGKV